jgi:hypothetical protein
MHFLAKQANLLRSGRGLIYWTVAGGTTEGPGARLKESREHCETSDRLFAQAVGVGQGSIRLGA